MRFISLLPAFFALILLAMGCKKTTQPLPEEVKTLAYIGCEGTFNFGNASLSRLDEYYQPDNDLFRRVNGYPLGDVLQSMYLHDGELYLVVNNSNKIVVVDPHTMAEKRVISDLKSPRFMAFYHKDSAYVTGLYSKGIYRLNIRTGEQAPMISYSGHAAGPFAGWTEDIVKADDKYYVAAPQDAELLEIDPAHHAVTSVLKVDTKPMRLVYAGQGYLLALHNASLEQQTSYLTRAKITETGLMAESKTDLGKHRNPLEMSLIPGTGKLLLLANGVYVLDANILQLPAQPLIPQGKANFYGLGTDPRNNDIFVCDAGDFVRPGRLIHYAAGGAYIAEWPVGVGPSRILFPD